MSCVVPPDAAAWEPLTTFSRGLSPQVHDIFMARLRHVTRAILRGKIAAERWIESLAPETRMRLMA